MKRAAPKSIVWFAKKGGIFAGALEHFPEKWIPVFRRKCDKLRNLERVANSTQSERALGIRPRRRKRSSYRRIDEHRGIAGPRGDGVRRGDRRRRSRRARGRDQAQAAFARHRRGGGGKGLRGRRAHSLWG